MNVWLVTTGSSDVQLTSDDYWNDWYQEIKKSLHGLRFEPMRSQDDDDEPYRVPARVLGIAHDKIPDEIQHYLDFPLLRSFTQKLKAGNIQIDHIIVLMSDQSEVFEEDRETKRCPFWQDTCELFPILEGYFNKNFPDAEVTPLVLKPDSQERGLDDWDAVLALVRRTFSNLEIEPETIYVSHQAGTPAISSAVQFASLAKFGDRVQFLVSNEYHPEQTRTIASSTYLQELRLQQAKELLRRYDYSGVERLLCANWEADSTPVLQDIRRLLAMAIQWNFAKFEDFGNARGELAKERLTEWWWIGYEAAYLGVIRFEQGNTVEALFHSFRSIEGLISTWAEWRHSDHVYLSNDGTPMLKTSILDIFRDFLSKPKQKEMKAEFEKKEKLGLYGFPLYELLRCTKPEWRSDPHIATVWKTAAPKRNDLFHRLRGLYEMDVFNAWDTTHREDWKERILGCLNFVSGQSFTSLQEASLMTQVHHEIAKLLNELM